MNHRTSIVQNTFVNSISFGSIFEIGDAYKIDACSKAIAVQREFPIFLPNEASFTQYKVFSETIPYPGISSEVSSTFIHENPVISVNSISVTGLSSSSILQIGSTNRINAEARVKHIRQLLPRDNK
jgi:spore germination protein PE